MFEFKRKMVKLTAILNWNGFHNIPKKYINRRMFKGVVYGKYKLISNQHN